jgi:hypothetical protein
LRIIWPLLILIGGIIERNVDGAGADAADDGAVAAVECDPLAVHGDLLGGSIEKHVVEE